MMLISFDILVLHPLHHADDEVILFANTTSLSSGIADGLDAQGPPAMTQDEDILKKLEASA